MRAAFAERGVRGVEILTKKSNLAIAQTDPDVAKTKYIPVRKQSLGEISRP